MPPTSDEERFAATVRGMSARRELEIAGPLLAERRMQIIRDNIHKYNSKTNPMTERDALLGWAALAENQRLVDDLENVARQGDRASAQLQAGIQH